MKEKKYNWKQTITIYAIFIGLLIILTTNNVTALLSTHTFTFTTSSATANYYGVMGTPKVNITLRNATKDPIATVTKCMLYNSTKNILFNGTFTGDVCFFPNITLPANRTFYLVTDPSGGATSRYTNGRQDNATFGDINWDFRVYQSTLDLDTSNGVINFVSIGYDLITTTTPSSLQIINTNKSAQYYTNNTIIGIANGTIQSLENITITLMNSTGSILIQNTTSTNQTTATITGLTIGTYYLSAYAQNSTGQVVANTTNTTYYLYNISVGGITSPTSNQQISTQYLNITTNASGTTPSNIGVTISQLNYTLVNSTGSVLKSLQVSTNLSVYWNIYAENLSIGNYSIVINIQDSQSNNASTSQRFSLLTNALLNISVRTKQGNLSISSFSGYVYNNDLGQNVSVSSSNGYDEIDIVRGNNSVFVQSSNYAMTNNTNYFTNNFTLPLQGVIFYLYETNTLNITFHDQKNPAAILSGPNISLDLISNLFSGTYYTVNGTLYLTLLMPEDYTLRYTAGGFTTRFYQVTITNRSYQTIDLYLINTTIGNNLTIYIVDQVTNPVQAAVVKSLKYNLANNSYYLQEIATTDVAGKVIFTTTSNDEFYKFIVEYADVVKKITTPAYITVTDLTNGITIQIDFSQAYGTDYYNFNGITNSLLFNPSTDTFRFDWNDPSNVASQFCLYTYLGSNQTQYLINSSCSSGGSGTILSSVTPINGSTYSAYAYYTTGGVQTYLRGASYTYSASNVFGRYGLFLQIILTLGISAILFVSAPAAAVLAPFSLILGNYVGINAFSMASLLAMQIVGVIVATILVVRKR